MSDLRPMMLGLAVALIAACGDAGRANLDESLDRDLDLASSGSLELAPQPTSLELSAREVPPPAAAPAPSRRAARAPERPDPAPERISAEPAEIVAIAEVMEPIETPVRTPVEVDRPAPTRRPAPIPVSLPGPVSGPSDGGGGVDAGEVIGTVIGVVIRGGAVGDDDCKLPNRGGRGGIIRVGGTRSPVGIARPAVPVAINPRIPRSGASFP